ncbi:hypothetical protein ACFQ49_09450 [Kroppenstedtia eburnea]|uniref:hypothetical protein n=1 Tax=Kroppenstedtia eburnea TaxID=714067 RepID=UPI003627DC91
MGSFLYTPHTRSGWYLAKLTVAAIMITILLSVSFIIDLVLGWFFMELSLTPSTLQDSLIEFTMNLLFYWALVPIGAWIGLFLRSFITSVLLGLTIIFVNLVWGVFLLEPPFHWLFLLNPWILPHLLSYAPQNLPSVEMWRPGIAILLSWWFVFASVGGFMFQKRDVGSGE